MDILIKGLTLPKDDEHGFILVFTKGLVVDFTNNKVIKAIPVPEHNDLADKSVIIERMGDAHDELFDKVDDKALSECHVAFLKAVMYAPTVIPSTVKIPTEGIEPKGVWDETWTTDAEGERTT